MDELRHTIEQVLDYARGLWMKKRWIMITTWLLCPLGFVYVYLMPDTYRSNAVAFVDTRSMLRPLLEGIAIQNDPRSEVQMMAATLLSRDNVEKIARESDLDITVTTNQEYEQLIDDLSNQIRIRYAGRSNNFDVSFSHENPQTAQVVVQETLDLFVEGSLGNSRKDSDSARRFIDDQILEYEDRLKAAERRMADFQRQYADILPLEGTFYATLQSTQAELEDLQLAIKEGEQQLGAVREQLKSSSDDQLSFQFETSYDDRIAELETQLDTLKLRFTEQHPDVIETTNLLTALNERRQREIAAMTGQVDDSLGTTALDGASRLELGKLEGSLQSLRVREQEYKNKIDELRNKIDLVPQIEAEGISLNRDYEILQRQYYELLQRKEQAQVARKADATNDDLQFRIIEPPKLPNKPTGPNRPLFYTLVLIAGFGLGGALALGLSLINPVVVRAEAIASQLGVPILGSVTHSQADSQRRKHRLRLMLFLLSSGAIVGLYVVFVAIDILSINVAGLL